jgi:hypothetical protein
VCVLVCVGRGGVGGRACETGEREGVRCMRERERGVYVWSEVYCVCVCGDVFYF